MLGGAAMALRESIGSPAIRRQREAHARTLAALRRRLGSETFASLSRTGESFTLRDALALARTTLAAEDGEVEVRAG